MGFLTTFAILNLFMGIKIGFGDFDDGLDHWTLIHALAGVELAFCMPFWWTVILTVLSFVLGLFLWWWWVCEVIMKYCGISF